MNPMNAMEKIIFNETLDNLFEPFPSTLDLTSFQLTHDNDYNYPSLRDISIDFLHPSLFSNYLQINTKRNQCDLIIQLKQGHSLIDMVR